MPRGNRGITRPARLCRGAGRPGPAIGHRSSFPSTSRRPLPLRTRTKALNAVRADTDDRRPRRRAGNPGVSRIQVVARGCPVGLGRSRARGCGARHGDRDASRAAGGCVRGGWRVVGGVANGSRGQPLDGSRQRAAGGSPTLLARRPCPTLPGPPGLSHLAPAQPGPGPGPTRPCPPGPRRPQPAPATHRSAGFAV